MKTFVKISLLVFYVFFNAGLSYSMHFCGDEFQRVNVFAEYESCCESSLPMQGCCGDVSSLELPNTDQQISDILNFHALGIDHVLPTFQTELLTSEIAIVDQTSFADSSPPIFQNTPIYIFCQVFLI